MPGRGERRTDKLGGGIIDLLNKRLRDRLQEIEILNIFTDVCEVSRSQGDSLASADPQAVAAMHALRTPLLHRDLKVSWPASHVYLAE